MQVSVGAEEPFQHLLWIESKFEGLKYISAKFYRYFLKSSRVIWNNLGTLIANETLYKLTFIWQWALKHFMVSPTI